MYIYPYNMHSESVKALAGTLGARRIKEIGSNFKGGEDKVVINWGNSTSNAEVEKSKVINLPKAIKAMSNKLEFFKNTRSEWVVPWTTSQIEAQAWVNDGHMVVVRHILQGHSGEGVEIIHQSDVPEAPLYTMYIPKKEEYRVHLVKQKNGSPKVFDIQRKARDPNVPDNEVNWRVRNHGNGFIYVRNDVHPSDYVIQAASICFLKSGLDFCAMDVIWNERRGVAYVLEGNTAPGLTGTTLENYVKMFKENFL